MNKSMTYLLVSFFLFLGLFCCRSADAAVLLKDRLQTAETGDYIVTAIDKTFTLLLVKDKTEHNILIEEVTIPAARSQYVRSQQGGWRGWIENGAPGHTSWVLYSIQRNTGQMENYFSYTRNYWCNISQADNFLSTLLNLNMEQIPRNKMKRIGGNRRVWSPKMVFEGEVIKDVNFEAWRTHWPRDRSDLSGKIIIVYVPENSYKYPSYFPYWLEVRGILGKAKMRIIDSGRNLTSPKHTPKA